MVATTFAFSRVLLHSTRGTPRYLENVLARFEPPTSGVAITKSSSFKDSQAEVQADPEPVGDMVWISATGSKYHRIPNCGNMNPDNATEMTRAQAEAAGYGACKKCY